MVEAILPHHYNITNHDITRDVVYRPVAHNTQLHATLATIPLFTNRIGWLSCRLRQNVRSPSLCLLARPPFFQIVWKCSYSLNFSLATPVYLRVCVKHVNNELRNPLWYVIFNGANAATLYIYIINNKYKFANVKCSTVSSVSSSVPISPASQCRYLTLDGLKHTN